MQLKIITRWVAAVLVTGVVVSAAAAGRGGDVASDPAWRDVPGYLDLFAPAAHRGAYRAAVSSLELDEVLRQVAADRTLLQIAGAWTPRAQLPADAFGRGGAYNRWTLARLYASRQPRVARGARLAADGTVESWTLISPYPSIDLTRLEPGTLLIVLRIAQ